jgi:hypothetical protein
LLIFVGQNRGSWPHQDFRPTRSIVVDPTVKFDGIYLLFGIVGDYEAGNAIVVVSLSRLKRVDPDLIDNAGLNRRCWRLTERLLNAAGQQKTGGDYARYHNPASLLSNHSAGGGNAQGLSARGQQTLLGGDDLKGALYGEGPLAGAVAGLVGIECGVVSGVINLESSGVEASDSRPRHDEHYHEA